MDGVQAILGELEGCIVADGFGAEDLAVALDRFASAPRRRVGSGAVDRFDTATVVRQYEAALAGEVEATASA